VAAPPQAGRTSSTTLPVARRQSFRDVEIVAVDNGSRDDMVVWLGRGRRPGRRALSRVAGAPILAGDPRSSLRSNDW
jgi:hypothetical protein